MPLRQTNGDEIATSRTDVGVLSETPSARYDAATSARALALAEELQIRDRQTLTASEIESLGDDFGVKPEFVRRALAQIEAEPQLEETAGSSTQRVLPRQDWKSAAIPAAVYALLAPLVLLIHPVLEGGWSFVLPVYVPALVALGIGYKKRSKRLGAWGGGLIAFAGFVYGMLNEWFVYAAKKPSLLLFSPYMLLLATVYVVFGVLPGIGGAFLRDWMGETDGSKKRFRLHLSFDSGAKADAAQPD